MLGFRYRETLHGGFYLLADPVDERAADLLLDVQAKDVAAFVQSRTASLAGDLTLAGFADHVHAEGTLVVDADAKRARYELSFRGNDGETYRFRGHKEISWLNLLDSLTLLQASVYDGTAREIGRATIRFDARGNLGSLVRSIRVTT
jgi:hypothetical protein